MLFDITMDLKSIVILTSAFPLSGALQNLSRSELWVLMNTFKYLSDVQYL